MASIKVIMNQKALKTITNAQIVAARKTAMKMLSEKIEAQEIPMDEGTLQNVMTDVDDTAAKQGVISIVSQGPYAARLYFNPQYNFNQQFNTNAKGEWWEDFISGPNKDRPSALYSYFYKQEAGGYVE